MVRVLSLQTQGLTRRPFIIKSQIIHNEAQEH